MICIMVKKGTCAGVGCPQGTPHERNAFCGHGFCRQSEDTYCVPESKREQLAALMLTNEWGHMTDAQAIDAIMEIFGEEENHE